ncbi:methyltransferase domain-containing protein [Actinoplanes sp. RD1]|uniref:methyltransferase domain-containing protein n=1 Tax=Actinoplanes sp. RD1 TaxID=3064538 RepID=UPI00274090AD|nr:methyltransferase domain-containing protein [Actinoplanes sp. RD1]
MEPAQLDRPPFTDLDATTPEIASLAVAMLDRMSGHPEIRRVRHTAWEALRPAPGQRLLDAGCGAGDVARALAAAVAPDGEVVALDRSEITLAAARERDPGGPVRYMSGDIGALDLPAAGFDGVWCERVLQHVADPGRAVAELVRVTRPGGRVCLIDTDWTSLAFDGVGAAVAAAVVEHARGLLPDEADMGRTLRRRLVDRGLTGVTAVPVTCVFPDPASAAVVLPMVNPAVPPATWPLPPELRETWFSRIAAAGERGDFLAVLTIWVVCGTVPT